MAETVRPKVRHSPLRLAVLISGAGSTMLNLAERIDAGTLSAEIGVVIASNDRAAGLARAEERGLPAFVVPRKAYDSPEPFSEHIFDLVRDAGADLVCLAGFLSLIRIPDDYLHNVLNIHPALLPAFGGQGMYGRHVHEAVINTGCKVTGCTLHFADNEYDRGPILIQRTCPVHDDDTPESLAVRVAEQEAQAYPEGIQLIADGRVTIEGRRTRIQTEGSRGA
ncbi:MAG: phosphoribosylglycinamide formyltransferase [Phycisphaeraceae bacterium]